MQDVTFNINVTINVQESAQAAEQRGQRPQDDSRLIPIMKAVELAQAQRRARAAQAQAAIQSAKAQLQRFKMAGAIERAFGQEFATRYMAGSL